MEKTISFQRAFEVTPHPYLLLSPAIRIIGVNDAYLAATMTERREILGCVMFDVFPDNPHIGDANAVANLSASFARVLDSGMPHRMPLQRYDIRRPDGEFEERWWMPINVPVFDDAETGKLLHIVHHVEDVTVSMLGQEDYWSLATAELLRCGFSKDEALIEIFFAIRALNARGRPITTAAIIDHIL